MVLSNEELLKTIRYYQESLDRYSSNKNNYKLLSVIEKLKKLPIATAHLEDTGIGRTVNALRKLGGEVGDAAKGLVAKWKEMVVEEEEKAKQEQEESAVNAQSADNDIIDCEENYEEISNEIKDKGNESSSSHISSDTEKKSSDKHRKDLDRHKSSKHSSSEKKDKHRDRDRDSSSRKRKGEHDSKNDRHKSKKRHKSTSSESEEEYEDKHDKSSRRRHRSESSDEDEEDRDYKFKKSKYSNSSDSEDSYKEHKSKSSKSSKNHSSSSKSKSNEKTENKKRDYDSHSNREEKTKSKHRSESKSKKDSDCEETKSSSKHKSKSESKSSETEERKSKHESKSKHEKESSKSKDPKPHSEKHEHKDKKESKTAESKEKHSHKKDDSRKNEDKHKKSKDDKEHGAKEKDSSHQASKAEENGKSSSSTSKHKSGSDKKKKERLSAPIVSEKIVNGIDSGSGASFADALGMCEPVMPSKSSSSKKKRPPSLPSSEKPKASSSYAKPERVEEEEDDIVPNLLKQGPPEPLNINISSLLPEISPHYKPMGLPIDSQPRRVLTPDEALSQAISNKNMRTKVYSGNKSHGKVESLFDLCVRILQDNIDALEYTGGVPYSILKPVLERATPDQLFNMEHHNPYLIEDTDELWQLHCQKEFRTKKREELESWREMYMRCLDEREARLNAITANIKQSQDKSTPVRTTKLAYVDSVVKPPRNILRKQAKNGILVDKRPAQTPASRLSALATAGEAGKVAVPNPGSRAVERSSSSSSNAAALKPKKAPLMAKTLSLFKNRFRR